MFVIMKLGEMKSRNAVPVLKDYLDTSGFQYQASIALARIGDTSASEQMREKAYRGEDVNYAGQGQSEALTIIRDLEDRNRKDNWPKIAKQIIHMRDRSAKPHLTRLFNHEESHVRWEAADKFAAMADANDTLAIAEMSHNHDPIVRAVAARAMQRVKTVEFADELITMLNDPAYNVRRTAAKTLGFKKISKAVPNLEKALIESEQRAKMYVSGTADYFNELGVCEQSYIALYILTGKKYDYEGKTSRIERLAEDEKRYPTLY